MAPHGWQVLLSLLVAVEAFTPAPPLVTGSRRLFFPGRFCSETSLDVSGNNDRRAFLSLAVIPAVAIAVSPTQSQAIGLPEFLKGQKQQAADAVGRYRKPLRDLRVLLADGSLEAQTLDETGVTFRYIEAFFSLAQPRSLPSEMARWAPGLKEARANELPNEMRGYVTALTEGARAGDLEAQKAAARGMNAVLEEFLALTEREVPVPPPSNAGKFLGIIGAQ